MHDHLPSLTTSKPTFILILLSRYRRQHHDQVLYVHQGSKATRAWWSARGNVTQCHDPGTPSDVTHINALSQLTIAGAISATFSRVEMKVLTSRFLAGGPLCV